MPIMAQEVLQYLQPSEGKQYIDMTFGVGGHSLKILEFTPNVKIFALDRDPAAYSVAQDLAQKYPGQVIPLLGKFSELPQLLKEHNVKENSIDGFLFDLGCSSLQTEHAERGFSMLKNGPLDMRMDGNRCPEEPTAADVLGTADEYDLFKILRTYGQERYAKKIARNIVEARYMFRNLNTTHELVQLINSVYSNQIKPISTSANYAVKTFRALRVFVNNELNEINYAMILAGIYLKINGRLITIALNTLEDTIIKRHLTGNVTDYVANDVPLRYINCDKLYDIKEFEALNSNWKMMHKHVLIPTDEEIDSNPKARGAKFRAIEKVK